MAARAIALAVAALTVACVAQVHVHVHEPGADAPPMWPHRFASALHEDAALDALPLRAQLLAPRGGTADVVLDHATLACYCGVAAGATGDDNDDDHHHFHSCEVHSEAEQGRAGTRHVTPNCRCVTAPAPTQHVLCATAPLAHPCVAVSVCGVFPRQSCPGCEAVRAPRLRSAPNVPLSQHAAARAWADTFWRPARSLSCWGASLPTHRCQSR